MKDDLTGVEQTLRSLKWRTPSSEVLEKNLRSTLAARAQSKSAKPLIPRALLLPLAACWTASLLFWWGTPREETSLTVAAKQDQPLVDPSFLLAQQKSTEQLTHELLLALEDHGSHYR